tara:strand:+ start:58 stop:1452 length:1395 start_codon:yes stop_codon:yes gene_type:complete
MARLSQDALFGSRMNPNTGQYYSATELKRAFLGGRTKKVSSSVFGRRGGALALRPTIFDQEQDALIDSNRNSLQSIQDQLFRINTGLQNIYQLLLLETTQERSQLLAQQTSSRRLSEGEFRQGQEDVLERKIRSAIAKPIEKVQQKVGGLFSRIGESLGMLLLGWLTNQGIEALKANADNDVSKLEEIKDNVIDKLKKVGLIIGGVFLGVNGLILGIKSISKLVIKLGINLLKLPWKLLKGAGRFFGFGGKTPDLGKSTGIQSAASKGNWWSRGLRGAQFGKFKLGKGNLALQLLGAGFNFAGRKREGQDDFQAGVGTAAETITGAASFWAGSKATGIALSPLLAVPIPGARLVYGALVLGGGIVSSILGSSLAGSVADKMTGADQVKPIEEVKFNAQAFTELPQLADAPPTITTIDLPGVTQPAPAPSGSQEPLTDAPLIKSTNDENPYAITSQALYGVAFED